MCIFDYISAHTHTHNYVRKSVRSIDWPVSVGESIQPGHGLTITLTSVLPFAEYSLKKMILTCVSS